MIPGVLALPGAAAYLQWWFSCSLSVAAVVTLVIGVSLLVEFGATLLDCFLVQLVSIGTVAPHPCPSGVWRNGPHPHWSWLPLRASAPNPNSSPSASSQTLVLQKHLRRMENSSLLRLVGHCNKLLREIAHVPSLEVFKATLDGDLTYLV